MIIYVSTTDWGIFIDTKKCSLEEWLINLEQQYPIVSYFNDAENTVKEKLQ